MAWNIRVLAGSLTAGTGSHVYHRELVRRLAQRGHQVSVVCYEAGDTVRDCAEVVELPQRGYIRQAGLWRIAPWREFRHLSQQLRCAQLPAPDVVIGGEHLFLSSHAQRFPNVPWIYLPHSLVVTHELNGYCMPGMLGTVTRALYQRLQRWALQQADRTLRFTRTACQALAEAYTLPKAPRFFVNPVGVEIPVEAPPGAQLRPVKLLYVGQLIPRKRVDVLLQALALCEERDWQFDIVGDGPLRSQLMELAQRLGLSDRVRFHGLQSDLARWYRAADLLLLASRSESLGLVLFEAMSYGVPCLGLRTDGLTCFNVNEELIDHGRTGLLAHGDADFILQLDQVLRDPRPLRAMGVAARQEVLRRFRWDDHLDRYEGLIAELTGTPASLPVKSISTASRTELTYAEEVRI